MKLIIRDRYSLLSVCVALTISLCLPIAPLFSEPFSPTGDTLVSPRCAESKILSTSSVARFQKAVIDLRAQEAIGEKPDPSVVVSAMSSPEKLLALIEFSSKSGAYEGFRFSEDLKELDQKNLEKIFTSIRKATRKGKISTNDLDGLLLKIYRLVREPKGALKLFRELKSVRLVGVALHAQKFREQLEITLGRDGVQEAMAIVITNPTRADELKGFFQKYGSWVEAAAIWWSSIFIFGDTPVGVPFWIVYLPPVIPSLALIFDLKISEETKAIFRERGLDERLLTVESNLKKSHKAVRYTNLVRGLYMSALGILFVYGSHASAISRAGEKMGQEVMENYNQWTDTLLQDARRLTPEQRGIRDFQMLMEQMERDGNPIDQNSPEAQTVRKQYIERALRVYK